MASDGHPDGWSASLALGVAEGLHELGVEVEYLQPRRMPWRRPIHAIQPARMLGEHADISE
jgi:hypothetical protein